MSGRPTAVAQRFRVGSPEVDTRLICDFSVNGEPPWIRSGDPEPLVAGTGRCRRCDRVLAWVVVLDRADRKEPPLRFVLFAGADGQEGRRLLDTEPFRAYCDGCGSSTLRWPGRGRDLLTTRD